MIQNSFIFLERVSTKKEQNIWKQNVTHWNQFLKIERIKGISKESKLYYNRVIEQAQEAILTEDLSFFNTILPQKENWRLYNKFKEECCFLDIEIDSYGRIVLVGLSDMLRTVFFVKGVNLEKEIIEKELMKYKIIITFNGSSFDIPKLKKEYKIKFNLIHIDLKPLCVNLGMVGGLKEIEKELDLQRPAHLYGNPIELWKSFHASGDREYFDLLLEYNREDVENLRPIMNTVYRKMCAKVFKPYIPSFVNGNSNSLGSERECGL